MQWTSIGSLQHPKTLGCRSAQPAPDCLFCLCRFGHCGVQHHAFCRAAWCSARVLARSLQGAQLGLFSAPRTTDSAQFRWPGPCREKRELGGTPGTTDLRRVQRKLRYKSSRQPFGFKKMHGNQTYPSSPSVLNRRPLLAQTKGRRACLASRRPWINPGSRFRLAAPRHAAAGPIGRWG